MTHREPLPPQPDSSPSTWNRMNLGAGKHYQMLATQPNNIPEAALHELADQMTPIEAVEQLTGVVDGILEGGREG